jgi:hypothetical protein
LDGDAGASQWTAVIGTSGRADKATLTAFGSRIRVSGLTAAALLFSSVVAGACGKDVSRCYAAHTRFVQCARSGARIYHVPPRTNVDSTDEQYEPYFGARWREFCDRFWRKDDQFTAVAECYLTAPCDLIDLRCESGEEAYRYYVEQLRQAEEHHLGESDR